MPMTAQKFFERNDHAGGHGIESDFFHSLKMKNGTFKSTRDSRFTEMELIVSDLLENRKQNVQHVLDVGVSSGITTLELADSLSSKGIKADITATDLYIEAQIVPLAGCFRVLADLDGWPLQYDLCGIPIRSWTRRLDYLTLTALPRLAAKHLLKKRVRSLIQREKGRPVQLVSPRLSARPEVKLVQDDVMKLNRSFIRRFDFIRAANILNSTYFSAEEITLASENLVKYLRVPGGILLVTRTDDQGLNAGSFFEISSARQLTVVARVGPGSEIERFFLSRTFQGTEDAAI